MTSDLDAFESVYWNLAQVFAWICLYDREAVSRLSDLTDDRPSAAYVAVCAALREDVPSGRRESTTGQILAALQSGRIKAIGMQAGGVGPVEIPTIAWAELRLKFDPDQAMVVNAHGILEPRWTRLKFLRVEILVCWPELRTYSAGPSPPSISPRDLPAWLKHDMWTHAEAMLILHGCDPRFPWTTDDELTTHFMQAKVYLNRAVQSGTIGQRKQIDGRMQIIDSPTRWYTWAQGKIDIPIVVRSAFLEFRYSSSPRLHYLQVKRMLTDRFASGPEELAMWLFDDELIAWVGRDPEAHRFYFDWGPGQDFDYVVRLTDLYFAKEQIVDFSPCDRWATYPALLERWSALMTRSEAQTLIAGRVGVGDLMASHPLAGMPADEGDPTLDTCTFRVAEIEAIESDIGQELKPIPPSSAAGTIKAEKECGRWLEEMMRNGEPEAAKPAYLTEALARFPGLSQRSFAVAWKNAINLTENTAWSRAGRKLKHRTDTPK